MSEKNIRLGQENLKEISRIALESEEPIFGEQPSGTGFSHEQTHGLSSTLPLPQENTEKLLKNLIKTELQEKIQKIQIDSRAAIVFGNKYFEVLDTISDK